MSKILITGGLGNLGSWITEYLVEKGHEVWVLTKNFRKLQTKAKFHLIHADLADFEELRQKLNDLSFDYVVHAGSANDGFVPNYYRLAIEINTLGTRNLLEWLKVNPVRHLVYLSTFQVYGVYSGTITEQTPTQPTNDYGSTHLFAEFFVRQFMDKIPYTILRLTNSYGCPKDTNTSKWYLVLNDLAKSAFEKKEIQLQSNGKAPRDFIWMGDVCEVIAQLLQQNPTRDVYNLSGQKTWQILEIANLVQTAYLEKYGKKIAIKINEKDTSAYATDLWVSSEKLRKIVTIPDKVCFVEEAQKIFELLSKRK